MRKIWRDVTVFFKYPLQTLSVSRVKIPSLVR